MYITHRVAILKDRSQSYIIGPTRKQQAEILWAPNRLQTFGPPVDQKPMESQLRLNFPGSESFIKIDGSDNYEAYRGTEFDMMVLDEYKDIDRRFYNACYPNLLSKDGVLVVIGTPPDTDGHYIELRDEAKADPDWAFFHATSWDNTKLPGGREWLTKEKRKYYARGDGAIWEREYEARFIPGGANAVFPVFSKKQHVRDYDILEAEVARDKRKLQWYTVSDPATSTVFGVLFIAYNPYTSQIYVLDEIYEKDRTKTSSRQIWERVVEKKNFLNPHIKPDDWMDVFDEAAAWFQNEVAAHFNHGLIPTRKFTADKETQISLIKDAMCREGTFFVASECKFCRWELSNYVTLDNGSYPKKNDHLIDCLRYFFDISGYTFNMEARSETIDVFRTFTPEQDMEREEMGTDPLGGLMDLGPLEDYWEC